MHQPIKLAVIYGSTRPGRFCDTVALWALSEIAKQPLFEVEVIDPAAPGPAANDGGLADVPDLEARIGAADGFVVVVPEYNHSYPAPLKALIDSVRLEWQAKPVAFVSYGGLAGGIRAVEHLRAVFAELHAVGIRDCVSFAEPWEQFGGDGRLRDGGRAARAMARMLSRLAWWGRALKAARAEQSYAEAAA